MGWAKFDDQYTDHPKITAAGPWAELLDMRAVIHAARYETDGHIAPSALPKLGLNITSVRKRVAALVSAGRWHEPGHDCPSCAPISEGWVIHDFLEYHPSREEKEAERAAARDRMARNREKKRRSSGERSGEQNTKFEERSDYPDPAPPDVPNGTLGAVPPVDKPKGWDPAWRAVEQYVSRWGALDPDRPPVPDWMAETLRPIGGLEAVRKGEVNKWDFRDAWKAAA